MKDNEVLVKNGSGTEFIVSEDYYNLNKARLKMVTGGAKSNKMSDGSDSNKSDGDSDEAKAAAAAKEAEVLAAKEKAASE